MTYIVKTLNDGKIGVYDTAHASYPIETPDLRAAGIDRLGWFKGKDGATEAERIAELLNAFHNMGENLTKAGKALAKTGEAAAVAEKALADVAYVLIEDEKKARAA